MGLEYEQRNERVEEKSQFQLALHDEFWVQHTDQSPLKSRVV